MTKFNLSEWSLTNKSVVWYFITVVTVFGLFAYFRLGRMEDPDFTVRTMVVSAAWPGATAAEMEEQVTDKLEQKIRDLPRIDYLKSYSKPGECVIYINLNEATKSSDIRPTWRDVRNYCGEVTLPEGVRGPFYNDRFDDVFGSVYAVTGDGYSLEELRAEAEKVRRQILQVKDVKKVELVGVQTEKVYIEADKEKLSASGLTPSALAAALKTQNNIAPAAKLETASDNVFVRITGTFANVEDIENTPLNANGQIIRVGDIARVERRPVEPAEPTMFFNGEPAIGISVSMEAGGNVLKLGENLTNLVAAINADYPVGLSIERVADQPAVVKDSIDEFVGNLREAVVIVMIMSLLSLGLRTGIVVGACIPLVLVGTFCVMYALNIDLHKISLGSLIVSLGLLVDDEIIAIEMMSVKLDEGLSKLKAAAAIFSESATPMLYGTLITCAGFIPVAFAPGQASEFCAALFPVIVSTLLLSWVVAIMVAPLLGSYLIKPNPYKSEGEEVKSENGEAAELQNPLYQTRFYKIFRRVLETFLRHRYIALAGALAIFVVSLFGAAHFRSEFFPPSTRPEVVVDLRLPEGSSIKASQAEATKLAKWLDEHQDEIKNYSYYVGKGAPRFILTLEPVLPASNFSQFLIVAKDYKERLKLEKELREVLANEFPSVRATLKIIQLGPPAEYPIMMRLSGYDRDEVRRLANEAKDIVARDDNVRDVSLNWNEKTKAVKLHLDQDKLRQLGISGQEIAQTIYTEITGATVAQYYRGDRTIDVMVRLAEADRDNLAAIGELPIYLGRAGYVPLSQLAQIEIVFEDGLIWRRNSLPTVTIQGTVFSGTANDTTQKAFDDLAEFRANLPPGYKIEIDGALETSNKSKGYISAPVPIMIISIMTLLILLQRSVKTMLMTIATLPLGLIGVIAGMLLFDKAMGFVAILGVLSLSGMVARNSIILIDQIQRHEAEGLAPWHALIGSAMIRFRPIMLTAGTSILGMVPLMPTPFWGPMAVAIAAGLFVATALTLLVLPTMYAVIYKVEEV